MTHALWLNVLKGAGLAQKTTGDIMLGAAGLCLAGSTVAFAAYMVATSDQGPRINAADKLAIFAKPVSTPYNPPLRNRAEEFDNSPVSTIRTRVSAKPPAPEKVVVGYYMRGYSQGQALVQGPEGFIAAKVGGEIEGLGRVVAIEARGRNLVVVTTGGIIAGDD